MGGWLDRSYYIITRSRTCASVRAAKMQTKWRQQPGVLIAWPDSVLHSDLSSLCPQKGALPKLAGPTEQAEETLLTSAPFSWVLSCYPVFSSLQLASFCHSWFFFAFLLSVPLYWNINPSGQDIVLLFTVSSVPLNLCTSRLSLCIFFPGYWDVMDSMSIYS